MKGNLSMRRAWAPFKYMYPSNSQTPTNNRLINIIQQFPGEDTQLLDCLSTLYIAEGDTIELPSYAGYNNPHLDTGISETEVRAALMKIPPGSASGQDGVTMKLL